MFYSHWNCWLGEFSEQKDVTVHKFNLYKNHYTVLLLRSVAIVRLYFVCTFPNISFHKQPFSKIHNVDPKNLSHKLKWTQRSPE